MILGLGNDLVDIRRIERSIERYGARFVQRVFTEDEQDHADRRAGASGRLRACAYAKRFAAKEACAKALGTGFSDGVAWRDIGVVSLPSGQPTLHLTGGAADRLRAMTPPGMTARIHLTMTDEYPMAQAVAIIEAVSG